MTHEDDFIATKAVCKDAELFFFEKGGSFYGNHTNHAACISARAAQRVEQSVTSSTMWKTQRKQITASSLPAMRCDSRTADAEFLLAKRQYIAATGRVRGADDVIAYHVRQSFHPGEITPEEANRLGVEFAKRFTKGQSCLCGLHSHRQVAHS